MDKFIQQIIKSRKKELGVSSKWILENSDISERTLERLVHGENTDTLFGNVYKVSKPLKLCLGDFDPEFIEYFGGKRVADVVREYLATLQENAALKLQLEDSTNTAVLQGQIDALLCKVAHLERENEKLSLRLEYAERLNRVHESYMDRDRRRPSLRKVYRNNNSK